ncbi:hypothetical protein HPP92_011584 [Vanilla planifolia]|uniref:Uncharacterized protein n=1 Tax=Vanilla planifolia TaxID=51239 RepID=A0A835R130_VANPL|nr:hypothetical protein HPP92_011584 [Vanilla planifolia]
MEAKAGKRSPFSKFSWADEVEKEEKQETRDTVRDLLPRENLNWQLNPFGDARPREVVLEERAINWKTNDRELGQQSNLRRSIKSKENIPLVPSSTKRTEQKWAARKNHKMKNNSPLVPVIKHLPKNIVALSDIGCENLGYKRCPANCKITANFPLQVRHGFHSPYMVFIPPSKMNKVGEMKMSPHIEMTINVKDVGCTRKCGEERFFCEKEDIQASKRIQFSKTRIRLPMERFTVGG